MTEKGMLKISIDSKIRVFKDGLPQPVIAELEKRLIFANPAYLENQQRGYSNWNTPEKLYFLYIEDGHLTMPRGFISQLENILKYNGITYQIEDQTRILPEVSFPFKGQLHDFQKDAVTAILSKRFGVLEAPTGSGKTIMALNAISERKQPALIVVHTRELLYQWADRINEFLGIDKDEIGIIGNGKSIVGKKVTVGIINSLYKYAENVRDKVGFIVIDECHRTPSRTFTEAVSGFDCRYMLGLSATPYRRDGLTKLIYFHCGDRVHTIESKKLQAINKIMTATLKVRETNFNYFYSDDYQDMITALTNDKTRNDQIARDVISQAKSGKGMSLVISDRKNHCKALYSLIQAKGIKTRLLTGDVSNGERKNVINELNDGNVAVLIATSQLVGEGFDLKALSNIFLSVPVKFSGRVKQYIGRVLRTDKGKKNATVFDYVDKPGVLKASFKSRCYAYKDLGITMN